MYKNDLIKDLQIRIRWNEFLENMKTKGFERIQSIDTAKASRDKNYKKLLASGKGMVVNSKVQSLGLKDPSLLSLFPYIIFRPINESQLKDIILESKKFKIPITYAGGKTGLSGGFANYGIIVDMTEFHHLNQKYDLDPNRGIIIVEQGVLVSDLIKIVINQSNNKFIFPIQPASALKLPVRVGGIISSNASGVTSGKLGATEDWVDSITIMTPNGEIKEIDRQSPFFEIIIGGNGHYGVILSARFRLYQPEITLKRAILYGHDLNAAFNGLQRILELNILPLISEFVCSPLHLPGIFNDLKVSRQKEQKVKWAVMIKGNPGEIDSFIKVMQQKSNGELQILSEDQFQRYLQERSTFALLVQTTDKSSNFIAFPGFEDILSPPKYLPKIIERINKIFTKKGFNQVIFGYGHINFRKGKGLLLHMRLPVPIDYMYKENRSKLTLVCETVYEVIITLSSEFNIQPKAEHSSGLFKIWLDADHRNRLRNDIRENKAFYNPALLIFDEILSKAFNRNVSHIEEIDANLDDEMKKKLFIDNMMLYIH